MTDLEARLAGLTPEQRQRFDRLLRESGRAENTFPLSLPQQGVWFLEQVHPNNPAYVVPAAALLRGALDVGVLRAAADEIVRRHEALRTTVQLRDGRPVQVVAERLTLDVPVLDLAGADPHGERVRAEITRSVREPFDLATGPLLRLRLLRIAPEEHVLTVALHHLIADGWSVGVLLAELAELYPAFAAGRPSPLAALPVQYGDYAVWQRARVEDPELDVHLDHWRQHLAGAPVLALPTDRPRPAVQGFAGDGVPFTLPRAAATALAALGRRHGATPYMSLLAVLAVLLSRYSGQDDVVVGMPTAGRSRSETEPLIGFFVNTLPIRTDLRGEPGFAGVLERVRDACLGAYRHQEVPFERIVEQIAPTRDLSRSPVFQVCLTYQSDPLPTRRIAALEMRRLPVPVDGARFDLELQLFDDDGTVTGWIEYDRDLFDRATVVRLARHLRHLAELVVADPDTPVGRLPMLGDDERRAALATARGPHVDWPGRGWIHECIAAQAAATPAAVAVRFEGRDVSYAELDGRANRLAHRLRRLGVARGACVGVALPRSVELVVALLGIVRAGGAYLPLDPGYPPVRLAAMLDDAAVPVLLTDRTVHEGLPAHAAATLFVEDWDAELAAEPEHAPAVAVHGEDAAYVIFTSGSTGRPKGVANVHAAIRSRLLWMQDVFRIGPGDRVLQKTPFSFDVSVWEFFWPLMTGATLVVARPDGHRDPRYLLDTMRSEGITTAHFVPSMLRALLAEPGLADCRDLRRVICSGEALARDLQEAFFAASEAQLHNLYGPTEAAVDVSWWPCRRDGDPRPVPIGRPIANTELYVLDRHLDPVPPGVAGELYIGGRNLARGYVRRPGLTADRFVPDPFALTPGSRLYRTGDLARYRADGALDYLGRTDHQVKVRGFRVELGEIEAALTEHAAVREAAVVAVEIRPGDVRLVGYLAGEEVPPPAVLTAFLRERLPEHLCPAVFVTLPALPLTPSGKVDRAALPAPDLSRRASGTPYVAPRAGLEQAVAVAWQAVLRVERVGVDDNFFDLGGTSLQLAELRARLATELDTELTMVELFQHPTVAALTAHLDGTPAAGDAAAVAGARERAEHRRTAQDQRQQAAARRARARTGR